MILNVIKRDGNKEAFDSNKIIKVIQKTNLSVPKENQISLEQANDLLKTVLAEIPNEDNVDIEKVQNAVETALMSHGFYDNAKAFILKRDEHAKERFKRLSIVKVIEEKLKASNVKNQNANLDEYSFGGRRGEADSALMKQLALDYYVNPKFAKNHINNRIYIHDLDSYAVGMHNCLSIPLDDLLSKTVKTRQVNIRPANSVSSAMQLSAVYIQIQSLQQFGGVAYTHYDWSMVPYVRKSFFKHFVTGLKYCNNKSDKVIKSITSKINKEYTSIESKLYKKYKKAYKFALNALCTEVRQSCEGLLHNLNSLQSRSGKTMIAPQVGDYLMKHSVKSVKAAA